MKILKSIALMITFIAYSQSAYAYLIVKTESDDTQCSQTHHTHTQYSTLPYNSIDIDANLFANLQHGQYLYVKGAGISGASNVKYSAVVDCDNLGPKQTKTRFIMKATSGNEISKINESSIVNLSSGFATSGDLDKLIDIYKTNIEGLYIMYKGAIDKDLSMLLPLAYESSYTLKQRPEYQVTVWARYIVDKNFKGVPENTPVTNSDLITFVMYDELETGQNRFEVQNSTTNNPTPANLVKLTATCSYSLSNNGVVDFANQNISKVTSDRKTTVKSSLTLNMNNCYGVNKVKTYISNVPTTLENGLLIANTVASGAAANVGVGINVGSNYSENAGAAMYMNGSNPLEWNFGNTYTVNAISKSIPLDVYLLRSGGTPTTGDFRATATIMMDFI